MTSGLLLALLVSGGAEPSPGPGEGAGALVLPQARESAGHYEHPGLFGWGLGFELPYVGVVGGVASQSEVGAGYTLGGAISYEITPSILVRVVGTWNATTRGQGAVSYRLSGERNVTRQRADWLDFALGVGGAYQMRFMHPSIAPYLGADIAMTLVNGFEYRFDDALLDLTVDQQQTVQFANGRLIAQDVGVMGMLRAGLRLHLSDWLASLLEVNVSYVRAGEDQIRNTLNGPDVRTVPENIWLISARFAVRFGL